MTLPRTVLAIFNVGTGELLFLLLLLVLLFGVHKIPELARSLGRAQREFQKAREEVQREVVAEEPEAEKVRRAARDLGLSTEGRTTEELRAAIAERMRPGAGAPPGA